MRTGYTISVIGHALALGYSLISFSAKPFDMPVVDSVSADVISEAEFSRLTAGSKTAKTVAKPVPVVDKIGAVKDPPKDPMRKAADKPPVQMAAAQPPPAVKLPEPKPAEPKPAQTKPAEAKPVDSKAAEPRARSGRGGPQARRGKEERRSQEARRGKKAGGSQEDRGGQEA